MSSKKPKTEKTADKAAKRKDTQKKTNSTKKETTKEETKTTIPKDWKDIEETDAEKGKRRSLISALRRSISVKGTTPGGIIKDPMNIVITLSPAKHLDIIEYIEENVAAGGRAEWVRDSIRLKMRIERGVYGLNTGGQDETQKGSEEALQTVMGQFAEVMTKVMSDLRTTQPSTSRTISPPIEQDRARTPPPERISKGGPPVVKKIESDESEKKEIKPDRPSLDDAMSSIIVVQ
ncbi:MAG: hypothetical protein FK731_10425 [Asgard group archaeon]|nr:hypothetical protein [Asgard group archaeon]